MNIRPNSLEAAAAALSLTTGSVLLIETSGDGDDDRYQVMKPLGATVVAELSRRDVAIMRLEDHRTTQATINELDMSFDHQAEIRFGARISTFESGSLVDVLILGRDLLTKFDNDDQAIVSRTDASRTKKTETKD